MTGNQVQRGLSKAEKGRQGSKKQGRQDKSYGLDRTIDGCAGNSASRADMYTAKLMRALGTGVQEDVEVMCTCRNTLGTATGHGGERY